MSTADQLYHSKIDPHRGAGKLSDVILGGQDGLVNVLGIVLGVGAATGSGRVVLISGLAAAVAESLSMAAVAFTSNEASRRIFESERLREQRHIRRVPELERNEVRDLLRQRGLDGELLERVTQKITADPDVWVAMMMADEHRLAPVSGERPWRAASVVGIASLIGSLIPLVAFLFVSLRPAMLVSVLSSGAALFAVGVYQAKATIGRPARSGLQLCLIGLVCALLSFAIGLLLKVPAP